MQAMLGMQAMVTCKKALGAKETSYARGEKREERREERGEERG